jgi:hypothetical protein
MNLVDKLILSCQSLVDFDTYVFGSVQPDSKSDIVKSEEAILKYGSFAKNKNSED